MTSSAISGAADVLLVEDDPGDVLLTREAFEDHHLGLRLHVAGDGETAMRFLRRTDDFAGMPRPALVVLDLNLPRCSGLEVLGELKADPGLHTIPVVVLTTSQAQADISRSYQLHANAYVIKPFDAAQFADAIRHIDHFFLTLVKRPAVGTSARAQADRAPAARASQRSRTERTARCSAGLRWGRLQAGPAG